VEDRPEAARQIDRILRGVEAADHIVSDLLEFCRPVQPRKETISPESLLAESLGSVRARASASTGALEIDLHVEPDAPACCGDRRLLVQALQNLYTNAVGAMNGTGTLSIRARAAGPATRPDRVRIIVRDTGCGLGADEVARIFQPFYTTRPGGTGLGLPLVRKIVEAHGGRVHVVSAPGRGTSVVLDLPTEDGVAIEDLPRAARDLSAERDRRVGGLPAREAA